MSSPLFYQSNVDLPVIDRGEGIWLIDKSGKRYLDGSSGAVVANIGHGDERVVEAMRRQAARVSFTYRTQFENEPALALARRLVAKLSQGLDRVFYVSGGSEAVEAAIKLARQYHLANGEPGRHLVVSRYPSFHGSTLGALNATGYTPLTEPFAPMLAGPNHVCAPTCYRCPLELAYPGCGVACAREFESALDRLGPESIAAFILEPIGGASTGAVVAPDEYLGIVAKIARRHGILLIYDEVMTGVGRTGAFCAYQHWEETAEVDILTLSKGFGAGYAPLGAIVARSQVVDAVLAAGGFQHGHTYAGNPLACAVGLAVLEVIEEDGLIDNARERGEQLLAGLRALAEGSPIIGDVRGKGLLIGVEFVQDRAARAPFAPQLDVYARVCRTCFEEGLIVYPRRTLGGMDGDHVLIAPPLTISAEDADELIDRFARAVARCEGALAGVA